MQQDWEQIKKDMGFSDDWRETKKTKALEKAQQRKEEPTVATFESAKWKYVFKDIS